MFTTFTGRPHGGTADAGGLSVRWCAFQQQEQRRREWRREQQAEGRRKRWV